MGLLTPVASVAGLGAGGITLLLGKEVTFPPESPGPFQGLT